MTLGLLKVPISREVNPDEGWLVAAVETIRYTSK